MIIRFFKTHKPVFVLMLICLIVAAAVSGANLLTMDRIAAQQLEKAESSRKLVLPQAQQFQEADNCYVGLSSGQIVGYVFTTSSKGYNGDVKVMTGIDCDGNITGVEILEHSETPGLGSNAEKAEFREQYQQQVADFTVVKNSTAQAGEIDAISGATITSNAVTDAVNQAVELYRQIN